MNLLLQTESSTEAPANDRDSVKRLNLGCGFRHREGWTNVDMVSTGPSVVAHDLRQALPFDDRCFDIVYHSHVLEHIAREQAMPFLQECYRVMRPNGLLRVAVPDLESITRCYLALLERGIQGENVENDYDWIILELFDQTVRERSGGAMGEWLLRLDIPNADFVLQRIGAEGRNIINRCAIEPPESPRQIPPASFARRIVQGIRRRLPRIRIREWAIRTILGDEYEALQTGRFRGGGEIHQWMYDRYSLKRLLCDSGFENPCVRNAGESDIPNWSSWQLDTEADDRIYKPDSLFMEARRSSA